MISPTPAEFLSRVVPWPGAGELGFINLHWKLVEQKPPYGTFWAGRAFNSLTDFMSMVHWGLKNPQIVKDVYFCLSRQGKHGGFKGGKAKAARHTRDAIGLKAIWLDIDVKEGPKGYPTLREAMRAALVFANSVGIPEPTAFVASGGGLHAYWISDRLLDVDEWRTYAEGLKRKAQEHGLRADLQCTIDAARILRVPGTFNFKETAPREVNLLDMKPNDIDFTKELGHIAVSAPAITAAVTKPAEISFAGIAAPSWSLAAMVKDESLADGISTATILSWTEVERQCAFFRHAKATGGKDHNEPLWSLALLAATFFENGDTLAHELGNQHPEYSVGSTDTKFEQKKRQKEQSNLGYPSCNAIASAGCTLCAGCPHFGKIKSPLNLGLLRPALDTPQHAVSWSAADLKVSFTNVPHRRWLYGTYLLRGEITVLASPGGVGKTAIAVGMAVEIATGIPVLGQKIWGRDQKVLYLIAEDETSELNRRIFAFCRAHPNDLPQVPPDRLFVAGVEDPRVQQISFLKASSQSTSTVDDEGFSVLDNALRQLRPDALVLDPLVNLCRGGNMNDNAAMAGVMAQLKRFAREYGCAILIVHHTRKGAEAGSAEAVSGAASIVNLARCAIMPIPLSEAEREKIGILPSERSSCLKLTNPKANFAPIGQGEVYRLHNIELPNAEPPLYPHGDRVQAVARYSPLQNQSALNRDQQVRLAILPLIARGKEINGVFYPYTANKAGAKTERRLMDDAIHAVEASTLSPPADPDDLKVLTRTAIEAMLRDGAIVEKKVEELMAKPARFRRTQGLAVNRKVAPCPDTGWDGDFVGDYQQAAGARPSGTAEMAPNAPSSDAVN